MNPIVGWALAAAAIAAGWQIYGWPGVVLGITMIVFWLLLQFNRVVRVMKNASGRPVGRVDSAVMLNSRLRRGMTLMQVLSLTRSLGTRVSESPETWAWADDGDSAVTLIFDNKGGLSQWTLARPEAAAD